MMKVNFKPLWPEAIGALVLLSERFPDLVWQICSRQLLTAATRDSGLYVSRKPEWADTQGTRAEEAAFEELELRCHHLEELRSVVSRELKLFQGGEEASLARDTVLIEVRLCSPFYFSERSANVCNSTGSSCARKIDSSKL